MVRDVLSSEDKDSSQMFHTDEWKDQSRTENQKENEEQFKWRRIMMMENGEVINDLNYCSFSPIWENCNNLKFNVEVKRQALLLTNQRLNHGSSHAVRRFNWNISQPPSHVSKPWASRGNQRYLLWLSLGFLPPWTWSWCWPGLSRCRCRWCSRLDLLLSFQWPQMKTRSWGPEEKKSAGVVFDKI